MKWYVRPEVEVMLTFGNFWPRRGGASGGGLVIVVESHTKRIEATIRSWG